MANAQHLSLSGEHRSPQWLIDAARTVLGGTIDLDPASSAEANKAVRAARYFSRHDDGLAQRWEGTVFLNPPGTCRVGKVLVGCGNERVCSCKLVRKFWGTLMHYRNELPAAIFVGFSLEQLSSLQRGRDDHPLSFPICIPKRRISYTGDSPTHASYITLVCTPYPPMYDVYTRRFENVFGEFGAVRL